MARTKAPPPVSAAKFARKRLALKTSSKSTKLDSSSSGKADSSASGTEQKKERKKPHYCLAVAARIRQTRQRKNDRAGKMWQNHVASQRCLRDALEANNDGQPMRVTRNAFLAVQKFVQQRVMDTMKSANKLQQFVSSAHQAGTQRRLMPRWILETIAIESRASNTMVNLHFNKIADDMPEYNEVDI